METEDILKGFADGSKEGNSAGGNNTDCAEVLATIRAQTAEMIGDGDETENDAGRSTCETETAGEEREEGGLGSRESLIGCIVKDENVVKTSAGEEYPYDINWVSGHVQPGIVGGAPCFAFKVEGTWVPFPAPKKNTWRNVTLTIMFDRLLRLNDGATTKLQQHMAPEKYGYRVNWVPGCLHPAVVDGKVTMAARLQLAHWFPLGWMHAGIVEHWQFLVVLTRVSIFNLNVKDHVLVVEHSKRCWERIREEERQMVCTGYDSMADQGMWSMIEGSCTAQEHGDGEKRYMARIRRRHGCTTVLGWVLVVCPMTYEHGGDVTMRFRDPLGVPFHRTYSDGLLRDIRYMPEDGLLGSTQAGKRTKKRSEISRLSVEVEGPCGPGRVGGCSAAQGDVGGPSDVTMSQSPGKKKKCTPGPPRGQMPAGRKKVSPKAVLGTEDTTGVRTQMMAVRALIETVEAYLVVNFENTNKVVIHSRRVTIQVRDMRLVDRLSKPRWVEKYQGMLDEKARAEERQEQMDARHAQRDGSRAGAKKRKAVPRKGGSAKKKAA
ncbi:hypothetical protein CBR_g23162 [Chara braunii]|uniref:Core Histone H2A/H2B/H3 domain-containing protein n=1 Tax=Chara braunii TaxID=69332 RepID=A0A388L3X7_CHABU|nr:hypothetical protein CBR_g23162 [Chara braunii]|eukprot:GBG76948.1 hypothetical protein CBR_g23162 [Chara braunii]